MYKLPETTNDKKKMMFTSRFKLTWDESVAQFAETLPWQMIAFAIAAGSCLIVWLIVYFGDCCFVSKSRNDVYIKKTRRCGKSAGRLFVLLFAILVGTGGFWIACNTAGVSFWNILLAYGILTLIISVAFSDGLRNLGGYIMIAWTNKISEDEYIELIGMPIEGRIVEINILDVKMDVYNAATQKWKIRTVPTSYFISSAYDRDPEKEDILQQPIHTTTPSHVQYRVGLRNKLN